MKILPLLAWERRREKGLIVICMEPRGFGERQPKGLGSSLPSSFKVDYDILGFFICARSEATVVWLGRSVGCGAS